MYATGRNIRNAPVIVQRQVINGSFAHAKRKRAISLPSAEKEPKKSDFSMSMCCRRAVVMVRDHVLAEGCWHGDVSRAFSQATIGLILL